MLDSDRIIPLLQASETKRARKVAKFNKCVFHLHTPDSYDYKLVEGVEHWKSLSDEELLNYARKYGVIPEVEGLLKLSNFERYTDGLFASSREVLVFLMVAHQLLIKEIELVVVSDHNIITGFQKLKKSIEIMYKQHRSLYKKCTKVILGVEISCSDKCHVVGMFSDCKQKNVQDWLSEFVMSPEDGTYLSSRDILEAINKFDGIGYIAHINTADIFKEKYFSGAYKKALFGLDFHYFFGVSELNTGDYISGKIKQIVNKEFNYILDEDSHSLDEIGTKCFWIKGQVLGFSILGNVFKDFKTSITYDPPEIARSFIKSIYIGGDHFFKGKEKNDDGMIIPFSESMNSFIGGRGTGKSTILNIIEFLISQTVATPKMLEHILKQGTICLLYCYEGQDYYIMFHSGSGDSNDKEFIRECFQIENDGYELRPGRYAPQWVYRNYDDDPEKRRRKNVIRKRIQVYGNGEESELEILNKLFTRKFSINDLVNVAGDPQQTMAFILDIMSKYPELRRKFQFGKPTTWRWIEQTYNKLDYKQKKRKETVHEIIDLFNEKQKNQIRIVRSQKQIKDYSFPWKVILNINSSNERKSYGEYQILNSSVVDLFTDLSHITDALDVVIKMKKGNYKELKKNFNIENYLTTDSIRTAEENLKKINNENIDEFLNSFKDTIAKADKVIINFLKKYFNSFESFGLEFNINNYEGANSGKSLFKPIDEISMGQKVVAMLSFVLGYSEFIGDKSPLIIDQPEDNLDNQYIYKNLVQDFIKAKGERQVIIATHNSTIVVNAGCENVIVMESDNNKSWIKQNGYSQNSKIIREIINQLEGGEDALKQKIRIYDDHL